jgi:hypothetical protein
MEPFDRISCVTMSVGTTVIPAEPTQIHIATGDPIRDKASLGAGSRTLPVDALAAVARRARDCGAPDVDA